MQAATSDKLALWLLNSIELDAAALHVGRYCGPWRASTAGKALASFHLVCRSGDPALGHTAALFDIILAETDGDPESPSPLIARLVELLFFYLIRHASRHEALSADLLALAQRGEFMAVLDQMLCSPGEDWSIARMAAAAHMSATSRMTRLPAPSSASSASSRARIAVNCGPQHKKRRLNTKARLLGMVANARDADNMSSLLKRVHHVPSHPAHPRYRA